MTVQPQEPSSNGDSSSEGTKTQEDQIKILKTTILRLTKQLQSQEQNQSAVIQRERNLYIAKLNQMKSEVQQYRNCLEETQNELEAQKEQCATLIKTLGRNSDEIEALKAQIKVSGDKAKKSVRTKKVPVFYNEESDGKECVPVFTDFKKLDKIIVTAKTVFNIHKLIKTTDVSSDREFVYALLRQLFTKEDLQVKSLSGSTGGKKDMPRKNVLDTRRMAYALEQHEIRANALGRNTDERDARSAEASFRKYVTGLTRSEKTLKGYQRKKASIAIKGQEDSAADSDDEDENVTEDEHKEDTDE